jgi:single-stranded DNA-binding protein
MIIATIPDARVVSAQAFVRKAGDSSVSKIRVASNTGRKSDRNPTRFLNAEGWGGIGEQLQKMSKGDVLSISGEMKLDKYTDKQGQERTDDVITVTHFRVVKSESFFNSGTSVGATPGESEETQVQDDDGIPF